MNPYPPYPYPGMNIRSVDTQQKLGLDRTPDSDDHTRLISLQLNIDTNATNGILTYDAAYVRSPI